MLVCVLLFHLAHETAGAARTRSSLRPLSVTGGENPGNPRAHRAARTLTPVCCLKIESEIVLVVRTSELAGEIVRCPWHGRQFDIRTGRSYCDPRRFRATAYPVNVEPGAAMVKRPYVAETIKVAVESDYVMVDL